jgi:SAM-dependent methyltransferase
MSSWIDYWNSDHPIYVSDRHKALHANGIERDFLRHIKDKSAIVLDYGCGEALYAEGVARACAKLYLSDAAPAVREKLADRVKHIQSIIVQSPEDTAALPAGSVDLMVVNSLLQYLSPADLSSVLNVAREVLKETGRLVIADVIPPNLSPVADAKALLTFAGQGGFLGAAVKGLARTALSDYRKLRGELGFSTHAEFDLIAILSRHGFSAERVYPNFGHNQARMTFAAKPV